MLSNINSIREAYFPMQQHTDYDDYDDDFFIATPN